VVEVPSLDAAAKFVPAFLIQFDPADRRQHAPRGGIFQTTRTTTPSLRSWSRCTAKHLRN
jgi:hypothetical protein